MLVSGATHEEEGYAVSCTSPVGSKTAHDTHDDDDQHSDREDYHSELSCSHTPPKRAHSEGLRKLLSTRVYIELCNLLLPFWYHLVLTVHQARTYPTTVPHTCDPCPLTHGAEIRRFSSLFFADCLRTLLGRVAMGNTKLH